MTRLPIDQDKYAIPPVSPLVEATLSLVQDLVRRRLIEAGLDWNQFVSGGGEHHLTKGDFQAIEESLLASGHRFDWSAAISRKERPDAYKGDMGGELETFSFSHPDAPNEVSDGERTLCGFGDNVVCYGHNVIGIARYIRTNERVLQYLSEGVPKNTIAVIDDSGGTLTAPIIEQFVGIICAGGTIRSHLGILTREYGIPCFMNSKIRAIKDGDRVELEASASAKTTEDYQTGTQRVGRIWRLPQER